MKAMSILNKYFNDGTLLPKKTMLDFKKEADQLAPEDKRELAELAAIELGVDLDA